MANIVIIGHGFVGKAVEYGFNNSINNITIIDPIYDTSVEDVDFKNTDFIFICVPTPMKHDKSIDSSILEDVLDHILDKANSHRCITVIKSTVTPDILSKYENNTKPILYNPEFLRERTANEDFVNPDFHIIGYNDKEAAHSLYSLYIEASNCSPAEVYYVGLLEASLAKYSINSFLALKVAFFNQIYELSKELGVSYGTISGLIAKDPRIGDSHIKVPGFDGKLGYGGACFPKDTNAIANITDKLTILEEAIRYNNKVRSMYELDSREKEQHISF